MSPAVLLLDARIVPVAAHLRGVIIAATSSGTITWRAVPLPNNDNLRR